MKHLKKVSNLLHDTKSGGLDDKLEAVGTQLVTEITNEQNHLEVKLERIKAWETLGSEKKHRFRKGLKKLGRHKNVKSVKDFSFSKDVPGKIEDIKQNMYEDRTASRSEPGPNVSIQQIDEHMMIMIKAEVLKQTKVFFMEFFELVELVERKVDKRTVERYFENSDQIRKAMKRVTAVEDSLELVNKKCRGEPREFPKNEALLFTLVIVANCAAFHYLHGKMSKGLAETVSEKFEKLSKENEERGSEAGREVQKVKEELEKFKAAGDRARQELDELRRRFDAQGVVVSELKRAIRPSNLHPVHEISSSDAPTE